MAQYETDYWNDDQLDKLLEIGRGKDPALNDLSDIEALQYLRNTYPNKFQDKIPEFPTAYFRHKELARRDKLQGLSYPDINYEGIKDKDSVDDIKNPDYNIDNDDLIQGYLEGFGLVDFLPDYFRDAFRKGANESITGIGYHILSGRAPFEPVHTSDDFSGMVQSGLAIGASMLYDWWFMLGTEGLGIAAHLAGGQAKKVAAMKLVPYIRNSKLLKNTAFVKGVGGTAAAEALVAKSGTRKIIQEAEKAGVEGAETLVRSISDDAFKEAKGIVKKATSGKGKEKFLEEGFEHHGKQILPAPELLSILHEGGVRAGVSLGTWAGGVNLSDQLRRHIIGINPETGQAYTENEKSGLISRYERGEDVGGVLKQALGNVDPVEFLYTTAASGFGGYVAGAVSGMMAAGKAGAFQKNRGWNPKNKKLFNQNISKIGQDVFNRYETKVGAIGLETVGFTTSGLMTDFVFTKAHEIVGKEKPEYIRDITLESIPERLMHDLVTIGTLKFMHKTFDFTKENLGEFWSEYNTTKAENHTKRQRESQKIQNELEKTEMGKEAIKILKQREKDSKEDLKSREKKIKGALRVVNSLMDKVQLLKNLTEGRRVGKKSSITVKEFRDLMENFTIIKNEIEHLTNKHQFVPEELARIRDTKVYRRLSSMFTETGTEGVFKLTNKFDKIELEIQESLKKKKKKKDEVEEEEVIDVDVTELGKEWVHKDELTPRQIKEGEQHPQQTEFYKKPIDLEPSGDTIQKRLKDKKIIDEDINTTTQKLIDNSKVGNKQVDKENNQVLTLIAKSKSRKNKGEGGADVHEAKLFSKWLFKTKEKSIKDATKEDLQDYLNEGGPGGKPFGHGSTLDRKKANSFKKSNILRWVKELAGIKGQGLKDVEGLKSSKMDHISAVDIVKAKHKRGRAKDYLTPQESITQHKKVNRKAGKTGKKDVKVGDTTVKSVVMHLANFVLGIYGKRGQALFLKGEGEGRYNIREKDIAIDSTGEMIITVIDKAMGGKLFRLRVPDAEINGINYYKIFKNNFSVYDARTGKGSESSKSVLTNIDGKDLNIKNLKALTHEISGDPKAKHFLRDTIYEIAAQLDNMVFKNSQGKSPPGFWDKFARKSLIGHKDSIAEEHYGAGYSKQHELRDIVKFWEYAARLKESGLTMRDAPKEMRDELRKLKFTEEQIDKMPVEDAVPFLKERAAGKEWKYDYDKQEFVDLKTGEPYKKPRYQKKVGKNKQVTLEFRTTISELNRRIAEVGTMINDLRVGDLKLPKRMERYKKAKEKFDKLTSEYTRLWAERDFEKESFQVYKAGKNPLTNKSALSDSALAMQVESVLGSLKYGKTVVKMLEKGDFAGKIMHGMIDLVKGKADETTIFHELTHLFYDGVVVPSKNKRLISLWKEGLERVSYWAEKNDSNRWRHFLREYGKEAEHEYLTQLSGEWALKKFNERTAVGRFGNWIREFMSEVKNFFGVGSPKDIARTYGKAVAKGFTAYEYRSAKLRYQKDMKMGENDLPASKEQYEQLDAMAREKGIDHVRLAPLWYFKILDVLGLIDDRTGSPLGRVGIGENGKLSGLSESQANAVLSYMTEFIDSTGELVGGAIKKTDPERLDLLRHVHNDIKNKGIVDDVRLTLQQAVGIRGGTFKWASKNQMRAFIKLVADFEKTYKPQEGTFNSAMSLEASKNVSKLKQMQSNLGRMFYSSTMVLRKYGGPKLNKLAEQIERHYFHENRMVGMGMFYVNKAVHALGFGNKSATKYIPYIVDKIHASEFTKDGEKVLAKKQLPTGFKEFEKQYEKGKKDVANGGKGTREYRAVQIIRDMYTWYWQEGKNVGSEKIKNPKLREDFEKAWDKGEVNDYFTRFLTEEAIVHLQSDTKLIAKTKSNMIKSMIQSETAANRKEISVLEGLMDGADLKLKRRFNKEITRLQTEHGNFLERMKDNTSNEYLRMENKVSQQLMFLFNKNRTMVQNQHLISRKANLESHLVTSDGKIIKTYESSFDKIVGRYIRNMSKYSATVSVFPEFTNTKGDFHQASGASNAILNELMMGGKPLGHFSQKLFKRRVGLEKSDADTQMLTDVITMGAKYSALIGLSSYFSGLKNLAIGTTNTLGIHGLMPFLEGVSHIFRPSSWEHARKNGWFEIGTKDLEITGWGDTYMTWGNLMKPTEQVNRVIGGFAGRFVGDQLVNRIRGDSIRSMILSGHITPKGAKKHLMDYFRFGKEEVGLAEAYGLYDVPDNVHKKDIARIEKAQFMMRTKLEQFGHILTQGATGDPFLPLWLGGGKAKAASLFYRMALSSTYHIQKFVVAPMRHGNFLPIIRHVLAGKVSGGALWGFIEWALGDEPPKLDTIQMAHERGSELSQFDKKEAKKFMGKEIYLAQWLQDLAKTEALGLWSWLLNPYTSPGGKSLGGYADKFLVADSILQPALFRNIAYTVNMITKLLNPSKWSTTDQVANVNNTLKDMIVVVNHAERFHRNWKNKWKTKYKNAATHKTNWLKESGYWDEYKKNNSRYMKDSEQQYYNLIRESFLNNDLKACARYYCATFINFYDEYRVISHGALEGEKHKTAEEAFKNTSQRLESVLIHGSPQHFSTGTQKVMLKKYKDYLRQLDKKEQPDIGWGKGRRFVEFEKLSNEYHHRFRMLSENHVSILMEKHWDAYKELGKIEDLMGIPPGSNILGISPTKLYEKMTDKKLPEPKADWKKSEYDWLKGMTRK